MTRLTSIEIEAFRGFGKAQRLDLDADVVLVRGDNGSGKTSLVDALLWLLTGEIPRVTERARGLRRGQDPIVNCYSGGPARTRISLVGSDGRTLDFERVGTAAKNRLSAWHGDESLPDAENQLASAFGDFSFSQLCQAVESWGILQQHAVRAALDGGAAMHERLSAVVGLERVTLFSQSATRTAKDLGKELKRLQAVHVEVSRRHDAAVASLAAARSRMANPEAAREQLESAVAQVREALPAGVALEGAISTPEEVALVSRSLARLVELATDLAGREAEVVAAQSAIGAGLERAETDLAELMRQAELAVQQAPLRVQLASAAIELLGDACPVCAQAIDEEQVHSQLEEMLRQSQQAVERARTDREAVSRAQSRVLAAVASERRRAEAVTARDRAGNRLGEGLGESTALRMGDAWMLPEEAGDLVEVLSLLRDRMRDVYVRSQRDQGGEIERLAADTSSLAEEVVRVRRDVQEAEDRCRRAGELEQAAKRAAERIVRRAIDRLEPSFAEVFDRLAPHPTFTQLRATQDIYYGKNQIVPEVVDPDRQLTANPLLVFSEGQLNVVALSYFLGLALNAREGVLPFLVLDDPLQTMDALGVLGFADLCRRVREHRQLVLSTHDRRFASLLQRKLAPREAGARTVLHEFEGWTREGPRVKSTDEPLAEVLPLLRRRAS